MASEKVDESVSFEAVFDRPDRQCSQSLCNLNTHALKASNPSPVLLYHRLDRFDLQKELAISNDSEQKPC